MRGGIAHHAWRRAERGRGRAHEREQIVGGRERRRCRLLPVHLQLPRRANRLLFPLADHGDVVALADHPDEAGDAAHGRLVDADERGAGDRRLDVARVQHAGQLHVHGPLQRAVHLGRDVVALRRLTDDLQLLHGLDRRHARGGVGVLAGQGDVEALAADQLAVGDALRRVGGDAHHAFADGERGHGHTESRGCHLQQHPARFRRDAAHRPAVRLQGVGATGSALVDGDVRAAHHAAGAVVGDVQFVGHDLTEGGAGALPEVGLADVERGGVVGTDDDPRVELPEVGIRIRAGRLHHRVAEAVGLQRWQRAEADDQHAGGS